MKRAIIDIYKNILSIQRKIDLIYSALNKPAFKVKDFLNARGIYNFHYSTFQIIKGSKKINSLKLNLYNYHFRRVLGDAINYGKLGSEEISKIKRRWGQSCEKHLKTMEELGIIENKNGLLVSSVSVSDFGNVLQWFIGEVIKENFDADVLIDVKIANFEKGGDIDLLCSLGLNLLMLECKGSPPNNISVSEIKSIIKRKEIVDPEIFILVIDTTLSIKRNILDNIKWITKSNPERVREGVYKFGLSNFIVTAKRDLIKNLLYILNNYQSII